MGRALGDDVLAWARSAGYCSMLFNAVVETNTVAVHLWQALGFQILTTVPDAFSQALSRSCTPLGVMATVKSTPRAADRRARVDSDGS